MKKDEPTNKYKRITGANPEDKIFIIGSGRVGTTFLVRLFTRLRFSTGIYPDEDEKGYEEDIRAGCEVELEWTEDLEEMKKRFKEAPFILKGPAYSLDLKNMIDLGLVRVLHAFIPVRDFYKAAESRIDVGLDWIAGEIQKIDQSKVVKQYYSNALALGCAIEGCMMRDVPFTLMRFPDFMQDKEYCFGLINRIFPNIDWNTFSPTFDDLANPDQVKFK
ncbi:hypothetical protein AKJ56_00965 [candidate division MSBL1 archaeon SCGC-AAA382N08]|uniref:Uncharacterized protein n=1 Tax=candidate division MSBL1 archaeon SCGC-AAA382N08 TaxID=1698285 RepID=A0A133VQ40_9EURY|nr:hypothetical protein AKJ56_00965 [candidate division MSBL1 archaeon SCGC-AAA382N08]